MATSTSHHAHTYQSTQPQTSLRSVELFTGAGGLALGLANAGFKHEALVEWNKHACETLRYNQAMRLDMVESWPIHHMDVRDFPFDKVHPKVDLLAGGVPCQPFSLAGKHRGHLDERNLFPAAISAVRLLRPRAVFLENVKGLLRPAFRDFFEYVLLQLAYPEVCQQHVETWQEHRTRLKKCTALGEYAGLRYHVHFKLVNAADYGVPQKRERVVIVAFRSDLNVDWHFPLPTHSCEALLWDQLVTGEYWIKRELIRPSDGMLKAEIKMRSISDRPATKPWVTVRDALGDLPDPITFSGDLPANHQFRPGAKSYKGHTGSVLDEPAKTLKAGAHGVPGGENTVVLKNGDVRYFTIRECARLQTFPDEYRFAGSWTEGMRQLGNAVPVKLAEIIASRISKLLNACRDSSHDHSSTPSLKARSTITLIS